MLEFPFTQDQFFEVFPAYNRALGTVPLLAPGLGVVSVVLLWVPSRRTDTFILAVLALFWSWMGLVYHVLFFARVNPAADAFGGLFVLQGLLFVHAIPRASSRPVQFGFSSSPGDWLGAAIIAYALVVYPIVGWLNDHALDPFPEPFPPRELSPDSPRPGRDPSPRG